MTWHVGTYEAKTKLSELLDLVEAGEDIVITRHGKPVARLVGAQDKIGAEKRRRAREAIEWMRQNRSGNVLDGDTIKDLIDAGRRS